MAITINKYLTKEQLIKLFSNPVSGIACDLGNIPWVQIQCLKNIRYSKSMILKALDFWFDQYHKYSMKIWHMRTPFIDMSANVFGLLKELGNRMELVRKCPDSFLFSHRFIKEVDINQYRKHGGNNLAITNSLLNKKYEDIIVNNGFRPQVGTLDPYMPVMSTTGISFTIFANEHPYIPKDKISRVGVTEANNVYVIPHKKKGNGAYTSKPIKKPQAPSNQLFNRDITQGFFIGAVTQAMSELTIALSKAAQEQAPKSSGGLGNIIRPKKFRR